MSDIPLVISDPFMVALLRWNLFSYRDLWQWLDKPFETPPLAPDQLELNLDSIRSSG